MLLYLNKATDIGKANVKEHIHKNSSNTYLDLLFLGNIWSFSNVKLTIAGMNNTGKDITNLDTAVYNIAILAAFFDFP